MTSFTLGLALAAALVGLVGSVDDGRPHRTLLDPPATSSPATPDPAAASWPVRPVEVLAPFEPSDPYGPGHRGVDLAARPGQPVRAALPGRVAVAGPVAGRPVVVVEHRGDLRTTYLPVSPAVKVGDRVHHQQVIGVVATPRHCPGSCLHWGARRSGSYVDPLALVAAAPVVLLPTAAAG